MGTEHDPDFPAFNASKDALGPLKVSGWDKKFARYWDKGTTTTRASPMDKCEAGRKEQIHSSTNIVLPPFSPRLFDHPSAFSIIAVQGAALMLVGRHDGVVTSRDCVSLDSTSARHGTILAAVRA